MPDDAADPPEPQAGFVRSLEPVESALDLGCGDGRLAGLVRARELTLADVSALALERAARRVPAATQVELSPDAPLPFAESSFDLVLCAETVEHVRDVQLLLSEIRRVLVPAGELALTTPANFGFGPSPDPLSPHLRFFTRRSLRRLLDAMGFDARSLRRRSGTLLVRATR